MSEATLRLTSARRKWYGVGRRRRWREEGRRAARVDNRLSQTSVGEERSWRTFTARERVHQRLATLSS